MAVETPCQTHGAVYGIEVTDREVTVTVELPAPLDLAGEQEALLVANLHNALELVLAPYWPGARVKEDGRDAT